MIEVQMRREDDIDVIRRQPGLRKRVLQVPLAIDSIDGDAFLVHLVADASIDQHDARIAPHEQWPHSKRDAILVVRGRPFFPERLRHDAKHGPAVETEETVKERRQFELTELHTRRLHPHAETSPRPTPKAAKNRRSEGKASPADD